MKSTQTVRHFSRNVGETEWPSTVFRLRSAELSWIGSHRESQEKRCFWGKTEIVSPLEDEKRVRGKAQGIHCNSGPPPKSATAVPPAPGTPSRLNPFCPCSQVFALVSSQSQAFPPSSSQAYSCLSPHFSYSVKEVGRSWSRKAALPYRSKGNYL